MPCALYAVLAILPSSGDGVLGGGVYSLGMLARWRGRWQGKTQTAWKYRELLWESGAVGQGLYLLAEAHGLRGTGIGCFFDDEVHNIAGLSGRVPTAYGGNHTCDDSVASVVDSNDAAFQSIYHFTVGVGNLKDKRVIDRPPYEHIDSLRGQARKHVMAAVHGSPQDQALQMVRPRYPVGGGIRN
jgi:hypothetical protein